MAEYKTSCRCIVVYLCHLDLHFPNDIQFGASCKLIYSLYMFFGEVSVKIFGIFLIAFFCILTVRF